MHTVGLKALKNKLSEYIRLATAGETIIVTDRRRVVAEIVPPRPELQRLTADLFFGPRRARGMVATRGEASEWTPTAAPDRAL